VRAIPAPHRDSTASHDLHESHSLHRMVTRFRMAPRR
jgi:hypothetical protein